MLLLALLGTLLTAPAARPQDDQPPERPPEPRGLVARTEGAFEGYTLITPLRSKEVLLLDMDGEPVHRWQTEHTPGNSVYLMDDGRLLRAARMTNPVFSGGGQGGRIQEIGWDGTLTWDFELSNEDAMHNQTTRRPPCGWRAASI